MKFLDKLGVKTLNIIFTLACIFVACGEFQAWQNGSTNLSSFLGSLVLTFVAYKIFKTRLVQSLICRIFRWDPFDNYFEERKRFNSWYDNIVAQKRQREREEAAASAARYDARNKAIFHENQARKYAGTNDGYYHRNMANHYRNKSK